MSDTCQNCQKADTESETVLLEIPQEVEVLLVDTYEKLNFLTGIKILAREDREMDISGLFLILEEMQKQIEGVMHKI